MRISDWSSDVCSSDLGMGHAVDGDVFPQAALAGGRRHANHGQQARIIIMTVSTGPTEAPPPSLAHDLLGLARHYLGRRRVLPVLAGLALPAGLTRHWGYRKGRV